MSGAGGSRRRLVPELLKAADAASARRAARARRERLDDELLDALVKAFNRAVVSKPAEADAALRALEAVASVERGARARGHARRAKGVLAHVRGRSKAAVKPLVQAAAELRRAGCLLESGDVRRVLVDVHTETGDYPAARRSARAAQRDYDAAGGADARRLASLEMHLGGVHRHAGRPDLALEAFRAARRHARRAKQPAVLARVEYNLANALATLDRTDESRRLYESAALRFGEEGFAALVATCEYALAGVDLLEGLLDPCLERLELAMARHRELGDQPGLAHCELEASDALLRLNRPEEADAAAERALAWFRRSGQDAEAGDALQRRGGAALQQGRPKAARRLFEQARELHERARNRLGTALDDVGRASAEIAAGRPLEALEVAARAARVFARLGLGSRRARALAIRAEAARSAGRRRLARREAGTALKLARSAKDARVELAALLVLARIDEDAGDASAAYRRLCAAERCVERLRCGVSSEESRLAFALDKSEVHERLVANRLGLGTPAAVRAALEHAERGKARALAERVARERLAAGAADETARRLVDKIEALDRDLARAESRFESAGSEPGLRAPRPQEVRALLERRQRARASLARRDPARAVLTGAEPPDPWAGVKALAPGELALEFVETDGCLHLLAVEDGRVEAFPDLVSSREVRDRLDLLRFQLGKGGLGLAHEERFGEFVERSIRQHLRVLHDTLLGPVAERLAGRSVRVVPHGPLHGLPFHALEGADGPLLERATVSVVPSLAVAGLLARARPGRRTAPLVLGVPDSAAPAIEREVAAVQRHLPGARVFRGEQATLEALRLAEQRPSVLHVACHGFFGETTPGTAALRLGDAWVSLPQIYGLRDTAEVVVLSGCETGRGLVHSGDEWVGLVRGFLQAGARAVVAALWEVHDETAAPLMARFHERLAAGASVSEALRRAQLDARAEGLGVLRWAPFAVVGDPAARPLVRRKAA